MANHVRQCESCRKFKECDEAVAIIGRYPWEKLLEAITEPHIPESNPTWKRTYHREYMREWRRKRKIFKNA